MVMAVSDNVNAAINFKSACAETVKALQHALGLEIVGKARNADALSHGRSSEIAMTGKSTKSKNSRPRLAAVAGLHGDVSKILSPRERYTLATEVINNSLRVLTEALRSQRMRHSTQLSSKGYASVSPRQPLQPRCSNVAPTPSPEKQPKANADSAGTRPDEADPISKTSIVHTAECGRLAFTYLRCVDVRKAGAKAMPELRLASGMLAFTGKLISLSMGAMAAKELFHTKRLLETEYDQMQGPKNAAVPPDFSTERQSLASLLQLNISCTNNEDVLTIAITYQMTVLRLLSTTDKPGSLKDLAESLALDRPESPAALIIRSAQLSGDTNKATKQLEIVSQAILAIGSTAQSGEIALQLQVLALKIRQRLWELANHETNVEKELLEPFLKYMITFVRSSPGNRDPVATYALLADSFKALGGFEHAPQKQALFAIHALLCAEAELASRSDEATRWNDAMERDCIGLELSHVRRAAVLVKRAATLCQTGVTETLSVYLHPLVEMLEGRLTGSSQDYDLLLSSFAGLSAGLANTKLDEHLGRRLILRIACFAQRYSQSYPGQSLTDLLNIIDYAVRQSTSNDELMSWISEDAVRIYTQGGVLKDVSHIASCRPIKEAWSASKRAVYLHRILLGLLLKVVRSTTPTSKNFLRDIGDVSLPEIGAMLESCLNFAAELLEKPKYQTSSASIILALLKRLSEAYSHGSYSLRRARVAATVFRLHHSYPQMVGFEDINIWTKDCGIDREELGHDSGLEPYLEDITANLSLAQAFSRGQPHVHDIQASILLWQDVVRTINSQQTLRDRVDDPNTLIRQMTSLAAFFDMQGDARSRISVLQLLEAMKRCERSDASDCAVVQADLAVCYLELGLAEKAAKVLDVVTGSITNSKVSNIAALQHHLAQAKYLLAMDDVDACKTVLGHAETLRSRLPPEMICRDDRRLYELLHGRAWLLYSQCLLVGASAHEALAAGKRAVQILDAMWSSLERSHLSSEPESGRSVGPGDDVKVNNLSKGISKLQLDKLPSPRCEERRARGPAFWPIASVTTDALMHLTNLEVHHGLYDEANYYSERAIRIAESMSSRNMLCKIRTHRSRLLTTAGRFEQAELCLTKDEEEYSNPSVLLSVHRLSARAALHERDDALQEALACYGRATDLLDRHALTLSSVLVEAPRDGEHTITSQRIDVSAKRRLRPSRPTKDARKKVNTAAPAGAIAGPVNDTSRPPLYMLAKMKSNLFLKRASVRNRLGHDIRDDIKAIETMGVSLLATSQLQLLRHQQHMSAAADALKSDVTMNILLESTLTLPSVTPLRDSIIPKASRLELTRPPGRDAVQTMKSSMQQKIKEQSVAHSTTVNLYQAARACLDAGALTRQRSVSTARTHLEYSMMTDVEFLLAAVSAPTLTSSAVQEGFTIDTPRNNALESEQRAVRVDNTTRLKFEALAWPEDHSALALGTTPTASYQEEYIDILPRSWTALSLSVNHDASQLHIARYQSGQSPLLLRLPFSRHRPDGLDEDPFDYEKGKAELAEIVDLSNYSCHNPGDLAAQGAKSKWWNEREALDRRLHELLINIESIWFGGFKSIFSLQPRNAGLLGKFRTSFEGTLQRHLPSRKSTKGNATWPALDDKILELFVGLGPDQDGVIDLDEPLADLLYFVVDTLQFHGERNAYDEIDFDSMAIDVLGALRAYHDACHDQQSEHLHLILVLDRRLQAIPWESLPCLDGMSVSRVGSMLSLRQRIMAMRHATNAASEKNFHVVSRSEGTYILNPSSDLKTTQTTLGPALKCLEDDAAGRDWKSLIGQEPSEERITAALTTSPMFMYFGHGAGSQYIRPRAIKRLESCSEVVWLMGCSSGAVTEHGDLEPSAVPLAYLLAGCDRDENAAPLGNREDGNSRCMAVVATLWDVTDKDIDRFSLAMGEAWGLFPASEPAKVPAKEPKRRRHVAIPSTPGQAPQTPKALKVGRIPAALKTPARGRSRPNQHDDRKRSLVEAVSRSRDACYLRYLNGAAPVVYGVPVYLGD